MPKQIIADTFETLGGIVQSAGQQVAADVKKMGEDVAVELGVKPARQGSSDDKGQLPVQTEEQTKKIAEAAKKRTAAKYREIQKEIKDWEEKRRKELPKQVSGKPGFSEEKAIKQLEVEKEPSFAKASAGKDKLPPLPVRQASRKTEMFRGASG